MVLLKIAILLFFCVVAFTAFTPGNFARSRRSGGRNGAAAGKVFFSFIGFDGVSTAGEEANASRDLLSPSSLHW